MLPENLGSERSSFIKQLAQTGTDSRLEIAVMVDEIGDAAIDIQ